MAHHAASLEDCLDIVVTQISEALQVQIAAVFLRNAEGVNVLRAAVGLNPNAPGRVTLAAGEGLVSVVTEEAKSINLATASTHPHYKPFPKSGEHPDNAFLGVPIMHQRKVLGALVVQHQRKIRFPQNDVAFLMTLSAQLAGAIAYAEAINQFKPSRGAYSRQLFVDGVAAAPGVCIGKVWVVVKQTDFEHIPDRTVAETNLEEEQFRSAVKRVANEINANSRRLNDVFAEQDVLLDAYRLILVSDEFIGPTVERIRQGLWAPSALRHTVLTLTQRFHTIEDPYLRERANDIKALGQKVLQVLLNHATQMPSKAKL